MTEATITTTEVRDRDARGALAVGLAELLVLLTSVLGKVKWRLLDLEAVGAGEMDLSSLAVRIEEDPAGLQMETDELVEVAADLEQVINAILLVPREGAPLPRAPVDASFYEGARLVLECVDGDLWKVTTDTQALHQLLRERFSDVIALRLKR
jgi:hypothetical protein